MLYQVAAVVRVASRVRGLSGLPLPISEFRSSQTHRAYVKTSLEQMHPSHTTDPWSQMCNLLGDTCKQ